MGWDVTNAIYGKVDMHLINDLRFHHLGYLVPSIEEFLDQDSILIIEKKSLLTFIDYNQKAKVVFFKVSMNRYVELVEPLGKDSHLNNFFLKNKDGGYHHLCYETTNFKHSLINFSANGYRKITNPATGFEGREIVFFIPKKRTSPLIELISECNSENKILN